MHMLPLLGKEADSFDIRGGVFSPWEAEFRVLSWSCRLNGGGEGAEGDVEDRTAYTDNWDPREVGVKKGLYSYMYFVWRNHWERGIDMKGRKLSLNSFL